MTDTARAGERGGADADQLQRAPAAAAGGRAPARARLQGQRRRPRARGAPARPRARPARAHAPAAARLHAGHALPGECRTTLTTARFD